MNIVTKLGEFGSSYLSHHPIPDIVDLLAMLAIGYQVQVIGELYILGNLLQNVDAEAFAALLDVRPTSLSRVAGRSKDTEEKHTRSAAGFTCGGSDRLGNDSLGSVTQNTEGYVSRLIQVEVFP